MIRRKSVKLITGTDDVAATKAVTLTGAKNDFVLTAVVPGAGGNSLKFEMLDPGANNQALSVGFAASKVTVHLATGVAGAITTTAAQIVALLAPNTHMTAALTATDSGANDGSGLVTAYAQQNLAGGVKNEVTTTVRMGNHCVVLGVRVLGDAPADMDLSASDADSHSFLSHASVNGWYPAKANTVGTGEASQSQNDYPLVKSNVTVDLLTDTEGAEVDLDFLYEPLRKHVFTFVTDGSGGYSGSVSCPKGEVYAIGIDYGSADATTDVTVASMARTILSKSNSNTAGLFLVREDLSAGFVEPPVLGPLTVTIAQTGATKTVQVTLYLRR